MAAGGPVEAARLVLRRPAPGAPERQVVRAQLVVGLRGVAERPGAGRALSGDRVGVVGLVAVGPREEPVRDRDGEAQREQDQEWPRQAAVGDEREDEDDDAEGGADGEQGGEAAAL